MSATQLRLVVDTPLPQFGGSTKSDARRVFEHWLFMFDKNPRRCKLGPKRLMLINTVLQTYDVETLELAIEGMASDPLEGCKDTMREAMADIEWLFGEERRIERWCARGEKLRESAARRRLEVVKPATEVPLSAEEAAEAEREALAAREHLRQFALQVKRREVQG